MLIDWLKKKNIIFNVVYILACYSTLPNYAKSCGSFRNLKYCLNKKLAQSCPIFKDVSNFHSSVKKWRKRNVSKFNSVLFITLSR